jgi:hypothetical protein
LDGVNQVLALSTTGAIAGPATLTAANLATAASDPLGLQLGNTGGAYTLIANATTAANALAIQTALGINGILNGGKLLRFYWLDAPAADAVFLPTSGANVIITALTTASQKIFESNAGPSSSSFQAIVYVEATNVTSGAEAVSVNILQSGSVPTA